MSRLSLEDRFWAKVDRTAGLLACWPWTGAYSRKDRGRPARPVFWYGYVREADQRYVRDCAQILMPAARVALWLTDGVPLDERVGLEACHTCATPACVNPAHLYWGTPEENRADRYGRVDVATLRATLGGL